MDLETYLKKKKKNILQFAKECGIPHQSMWSYVKKTRRPKPEVAMKLEEFTQGKVTAAELCTMNYNIPRKRKKRVDTNSVISL